MVKILVLGHARHGKDTVCEILRDEYGYSFMSSSCFAAEKIMFPLLATSHEYQNFTDCFNDRHNHREKWYNTISEYNREDPARLGREIFSKYDIYCGLRNKTELAAIKREGLYSFSIWVDAGSRIPPESTASNTIEAHMADYQLDNSGSLEDLKNNLQALIKSLH